jgi:hypothetical protein
MQASTTDVLIGVTTVLHTSSCVIALSAIVTALSMTARAETLALRCEGTKITTERKEPDLIKCFTGLWICLPRGKAAGDEIVDKDAAGDDSDPER